MSAVAIVEVLDVVGHGQAEFHLGPPRLTVQQLDLHRTPERLHGCVVVAVADGPIELRRPKRRTFSVKAHDVN